MKNTLKKILFVLILLVCGQLYAQTNQNWAPIGAKWYYSSLHKRDLGFWPSYTVIESIRQQLFQGKMCRVLQQKVYYKNGNSAVEGEYYTYEDSNKVYYWANNQFYKLYDFVSPVGTEWDVYGIEGDNFCDLIPGSPPPPPVATRQLGRIKKTKDTTIMVNNLPLKMFKSDTVTGYKRFALERETIQRIGNTKFMFPHQFNYCGLFCCPPVSVNSPVYFFRCYTDNQISYSIMSPPASCDTMYIISGTENQRKQIPLSIYPNPFTGRIELALEGNAIGFESRDYEIRIRDVLGNVVFIQKNVSLDWGGSTHTVNLEHLPKGMFFVSVHNPKNNASFNQKIVKL